MVHRFTSTTMIGNGSEIRPQRLRLRLAAATKDGIQGEKDEK